MDKKSNRALQAVLKAIGVIILIVIVAYGVVAVNLYSSVGRFPTDGRRPPASISSLIWPTVGYPQILEAGERLEAEMRLPGGHRTIPEFAATISASEPELEGLAYELESVSASQGRSERWPEGTRHGRDMVWRLRFALPADAHPLLYDLRVVARSGDGVTTSEQPNAVSVRAPAAGDDFTFVSLTDIHVHKRGGSSWYEDLSDKGIGPDGNPVFFQNAIDQVNLIRPDFAVILGDNIRAQHEPGDLQYEFERFFSQLERFRVPVFIVPGNHDTYYNEVDGARVWEENIGPLHYSFDVGDTHFTAINTNDWPPEDRMVMSKFGTFVYPRKWQGQVLDATDERKPGTYTGQLAWVRDDLRENMDDDRRIMLLHHDPYRTGGRADAWKNRRFFGAFTLGGGGKGSTALKELAARYGVDFALTGHHHSDYIGEAAWRGGGGRTVYANQTMVTFGSGGLDESYPGYRIWNVAGGEMSRREYINDYRSFPLYDGSSLDGLTDLDQLDREALDVEAAPDGEGLTVTSYLGEPVEARGITGIFASDAASGVSGAEVYRTVPVPSRQGVSFFYMKALLPAGQPGESATRPGIPSRTVVSVGPTGEI